MVERVQPVLRWLTLLPRGAKRALLAASDAVLLCFALWLAYALRLGEVFAPNLAQSALFALAPAIAIPVFVRFGLYRSVIRYVTERAIWSIAQAMAVAALLWTTLAFMTEMTGVEGVPRSIPILYLMFGVALIAGSRFFARWLLWSPLQRRFGGRQILIYGAGAAGRELAGALRQGDQLFPAGFIDDDAGLQGSDIAGLRVYPPSRLSALVDDFDIQEVIVCLPAASGQRRREVVRWLEGHAVRVRILPPLTDIASGKHLVTLVREVEIDDLLGRDPVAADPALLGRANARKSVLITGAGGSIGSELARQVRGLQPSRLVLLDASEYALYQIDQALGPADPNEERVLALGSIADDALVRRLLDRHDVDTVYHAAAHKHVPLVEANVLEGVRNNVLGSEVLTRAAFEAGVSTFVLISSDKAVRPTNVMGATKRWAELILRDVAAAAAEAGTGQRFSAVRFGNVLGSSGSVIPLFRKQISDGGPVTVTHADVTRYFMSISEAVELVIQAGALAEGGELFLLDMGEPVRIVDLAKNLIRLSGQSVRDPLTPDGDIEIAFTGLRPGEKLFEELLFDPAHAEPTPHPKILKAAVDVASPVADDLDALRAAYAASDDAECRRILLARSQ